MEEPHGRHAPGDEAGDRQHFVGGGDSDLGDAAGQGLDFLPVDPAVARGDDQDGLRAREEQNRLGDAAQFDAERFGGDGGGGQVLVKELEVGREAMGGKGRLDTS